MSRTRYVAVDRPIDGVQLNNDRVFLAGLVGDRTVIDGLCEELGVTSLCDFQSYDPAMVAGYIDDPEIRAAAVANAKPIEWFEAASARKTVVALLRHGDSGGALDARVVRDLRDLAEALAHAERAGCKIRLWVDS